MGSSITLNRLSKTYPSGHRAVHDVSLHLDAGEFLVLLGPSGCGKSTLLRMVAGLETITAGQLLLDQRPANDLPPSERDVAMIFQNFALYPTMTAAENIAFPLAARGDDEHAAAQAVNTVADRLGIRSLLSRTPAQLSGGERQRVAMGRAIIRRPSVFLMDEPLSSLDARLRVRLRTEILSVVRRTGSTTVYVTHDQAEAMALGDRIAVLNDGALQQIGTPDELYNLPANAFVASFVGTPRINLVHGTLYAPIDGPMTISLGSQKLLLPREMARTHQLLRVVQGQQLLVGLRPEALRVSSTTTPYERPLTATVTHVEYQGHETLLHVTVGALTADPPRTVFDHEDLNDTGSPLTSAVRTLLSRVRKPQSNQPLHTAQAAPPLPQHYQVGELVLRARQGTNYSVGDLLPVLVDMRALMLFDAKGHRVFPHPTHLQAF
ncbi:ABC transporter ATP-binding protein [Streptomyces sp. I4(2020)]|uniref:ABC transporter ATP-binding protein n=1 Tax=Streptomyces sp. I4(2020) TaxID=2760981 RepID=UPI0018EEBD7E|nr:ABC transporter ATP-binding protein [Streptomyces sp. I4(2020)]MBJ6628783.1 ABC transporter ATP-binding protein [Streptomyces sp. I4(2020)]